MSVLFINPATQKFGGFISRYVPKQIPVGIGVISAYMSERGIYTDILDEEIYDITPSLIRERVAKMEKPYVFGITCLTAHVGRGYKIAEMIKSEYPDAHIVFGGIHPTTLPEEALGKNTIDSVVRGEGEEVMLDLYQTIHGGGSLENVLGITYKDGGDIITNGEAPLIPDIDVLPQFPYDKFNHPGYNIGFMTTSRGCPFRCSYCSIRLMTGTTYRYRSADKIIEELDVLVNGFNQKSVVFYDDNFCLKKDRVHDLCDAIIENKLHEKCNFSVQTRADNVIVHGGEELVAHMAEAGFDHMGFGLETGVDRLAELIRKDETVQCHLDTAELCRKHNMDVSFFMIFGLPTETDADRRESYNVVKKAGLQATKYNNLIPYPGTPIWDELKDSNRIVITEDWQNFNSVLGMTTSLFDKTPMPYVPDTCSEWELRRTITRYNLISQVNFRTILALFSKTVGVGWFVLPEKWYFKPREIWEITKIGFNVIMNFTAAVLPLRLTEPIMELIHPHFKLRKANRNYDPDSYVTIDWDRMLIRTKGKMLKQAQRDLKEKQAKTEAELAK